MRSPVDTSALEAICTFVRALVRDEVERALAVLRGGEEYLTAQEAAAVVKVNERTIKRWVSAGKLERHGEGRLLRVRRSDLERYMRESGKRGASSNVSPEEQARRDFG